MAEGGSVAVELGIAVTVAVAVTTRCYYPHMSRNLLVSRLRDFSNSVVTN